MSFNKKILAAAIFGSLFTTGLQAQVVLSDDDEEGALVAREFSFPTELFNAAGFNGVFDIQTELGYNFDAAEAKVARIECSNVRFNDVDVEISNANGTAASVNGLGTNAIYFTVTADGGSLNDDDTINIDVTDVDLRSAAGSSCTFALYDTTSQASQGGTTGRIADSVSSAPYIVTSPSYAYSRTLQTATVSVQLTPLFNFFTTGTRQGTIGSFEFNTLGDLPTAVFGGVTPLNPTTGATVDYDEIFGMGTAHVVEGDFSALANADGTYTGDALARLQIDFDGTCGNAANRLDASSLSAASATFITDDNAAVSLGGGEVALCFTSRAGEIPESSYTIRLVPVAADSSVTPTATNASLGSIVRDGITLQAPFVQLPPGWTSRIVLTNTSSVSRPYTLGVISETGNTVTTDTSKLTGTIPARGTTVIDLNTVLTGFTGAPRGTVNAVIAAPSTSVQGMYQIVNGATGSISNETMTRPGNN